MIISVSGLMGSGKDSIAEHLINVHGFNRVSFASSLKDAVSAVFGWDRILLEGLTKVSRQWREQRDEWWSERLGMPITPRWVLQHWGTEVCREGFHDDIWVASLENKLRNNNGDVVITDARFSNELNVVKRVNGISIRVTRGSDPAWIDAAMQYNRGPIDNSLSLWDQSKLVLEQYGIHASEYSSVGLEYDHVIENNGTLLDLYLKINQIIKQNN